MSEIICDVVAKNQVLYSGSLYSVMVPGSEGELGIMANHEPFVSALKDGCYLGSYQARGRNHSERCHHGWLCSGSR